MTTKTLTGAYTHTYTLSASFTTLSITHTGVIAILGETAGVDGAAGLLMPHAGTLLNSGYVYGGLGGTGDAATSYVGANGGAGVDVTGAGQITNSKIIQGGLGGSGSATPTYGGGLGYYGSKGGNGGTGLISGTGAYVNNSGTLRGGGGGQGGAGTLVSVGFGAYECPGGDGGYGGAGLVLNAGGVVNNIGLIVGGRGGTGGTAPKIVRYGTTYTGFGGMGGYGGVGVESYGGGTVINYVSITGGGGGTAGAAPGGTVGATGKIGMGVYMAGGGSVINGSYDDAGAVISGNRAVEFGDKSAGAVINYGLITNSAYGSAGQAIVMGSKYSLLVVEPGSAIVGSAEGGFGGELELAGPRVGVETGTIAWVASGFGMTITTPSSTTYFDRFGTLAVDGSCQFTVSGYAPINHGYGIVLRGVLQGAGTMDVVGTIGPNPGAFVDIYGGTLAMGSLIDAGSIQGYGTVTGAVYLDGGGLFANDGKLLTLQNAKLTAIKGGAFAASAGAVLQLPNNQNLSTLTNTAILIGAGSEIQWYNTVTHAEVTLDSALTSVTATGTLDITGGRNFVAGNPITDSGNITVGNGFLGVGTISGGTLTIASAGTLSGFGEVDSGLSVLASGVVDATGVSLDLAPATHSIVNQGLMEATAGGQLTITGAAVNNTIGTVTAAGGGVALANSSIYGGTVSIAATGALYAGVGTNTLAMSGGTVTNAGLVHTSGGGGLTFGHAHVSNAGGTVLVGYNYYGGSFMTLYDSAIYGGALTVAASSTLTAIGAANTISLAGATITNNGVIQTTAGGALTFNGEAVANGNGRILVGSGPGHMLLDNCVVQGGAITVAAGGAIDAHYVGNTLAMAGGVITNAGTIDTLHSAHLTISGATVNNAGGVLLAQGYSGLITLTNTTVVGAGTVATQASGGPACTIAIGNSSSVQVQGVVANAGTISLTSTGSLTDLRILSGGVTLSGGGTVSLSGPKARILGATAGSMLTNIDNTIVGVGSVGVNDMTLINQAAGVIEATGLLTVRDAAGHTLTNSGLIEANATGKLALVSETISQAGGGKILAATGLVTLQGVDFIGGTLTTTGAGRINVDGGGATLDGSSSPVTNAGLLQVTGGETLTVDGAVINSGKLDLHAAKVIVGSAGVTLSGSGQVNLNDSASNIIVGAVTGATLTNVNDRIAGSGNLGDGLMTLVNQAAGQIIGNQGVALTIDTGANTIANAGLIENSGAGGTKVISAVNNTGTLKAVTAGTLTLQGAVTGSGVAQINGGTLYVQQAFAENVAFTGTTGVLKLGDSQAFTGKVAGLAAAGTNSLDLADIAFSNTKTKATYSGTTTSGTLTVTDGTHTAKITLVGDYLGSTFTVSSDGHGGTTVVDPKAVAQPGPAPLAQAMAGFQQGAPPHLAATCAYSLPRFPMFHARA